MNFLNSLNEMQRKAVLYDEGPLLILAGAGSGKTRVMTCKMAYLIKEKSVDPESILAVTFTNKAAKEMASRVSELVDDRAPSWVLTFHSACLRILKTTANRLGYGNDFTIYDTNDQKALLKKILKEKGISIKEVPIRDILGFISRNKEKGLLPEDVDTLKLRHNQQIFLDIYSEYQEQLFKNNSMDFTDLLLNVVRLFNTQEDILKFYQLKFEYVMVDEYQDTNYLQNYIVKAISKNNENICVVGDDDQCIYEWRGANIRNILSFENDYDSCKVIRLEQNYRSNRYILQAANSVISKNSARSLKKLWTADEGGNKPIYKRLDNHESEANYVCKVIESFHLDGLDYGKMAVLYRTHIQSRSFELAFRMRNIPYKIVGGIKYYDRKEIKDVCSYLRLLVNPKDNVSFSRIINTPARGIGEKTLEKIINIASERDESALEYLMSDDDFSDFSVKVRNQLINFANLMKNLIDNKDEISVKELYQKLIDDTGYVESLSKNNASENEDRIKVLFEFYSVIQQWESQGTEGNLETFLDELSLYTDGDDGELDENAVKLMTLHSAKGLEFPLVFLPGLERNLFPGSRALNSEEAMEEERRLFYVGITRAEKHLYLTSAKERLIYGRYDYTDESNFVKELDKKAVEGVEDTPSGDKNNRFVGYSNKVHFKPFTLEESKKAKDIDLKVGDAVIHKKFGDGMVLEVDDNTATVLFVDFGKKKLAKTFINVRD